LYKLYWVKDDGSAELFNLSEVLKKYGSVFVGRLSGKDSYEAEKRGIVEVSPYSLYIFKPGEFYNYMEVVDGYVSRRHALLELKEGALLIVDHGPDGTGSKNGTFINGRRIKPGEPNRLNHGDEISLGSQTELKVIYGDEAVDLSSPTVLGEEDAKTLRDLGIEMNVVKEPTTGKLFVYVQEGVERPIDLPSGLKVVANPRDPIVLAKKLTELELEIVELKNKVKRGGEDVRVGAKIVLIKLECMHGVLKSVLQELDASQSLEKLESAMKGIKDYAENRIDERPVITFLDEVRAVLGALKWWLQ
jgi:pSer/pThr/pTyr-binding forkhead associated (FHA) protein